MAAAATRFHVAGPLGETFKPSPFLPPLLTFTNGSAVTSASEWQSRRVQLWEDLQRHLLGTIPTQRPWLTHVEPLNSSTMGVLVSSFVRLEFVVNFLPETYEGAGAADISFEVEILLAADKHASHKLVPVFLTQWTHREWGLLGASRGYLSIIYPAADERDASPILQAAYPNCSMATMAARALVASLTVDYATTMPRVDISRIYIAGHSRNGKQALIAAAMDTRIAGVVGSSAGAPIASPYRFTSSNFYGEGPLTGGQAGRWWLQSILQYAGRPEYMPVDGHAVLALIAPRRVMLATARQDFDSDLLFANEQAVIASHGVFNLTNGSNVLGIDNPRLLHRDGGHHGFVDVHSYFDFFDASELVSRRNDWLTPAGFSWIEWNAQQSRLSPSPSPLFSTPPSPSPLRTRMRWLLDSSLEPLGSGGSSYCEEAEADYIPNMMRETRDGTDGFRAKFISFGGYISARMLWSQRASLSEEAAQRVGTTESTGWPAFVWLHPYSYSTGVSPSYGGARVAEAAARAGFVVLTYEQASRARGRVDGGWRIPREKKELVGSVASTTLGWKETRAEGHRR